MFSRLQLLTAYTGGAAVACFGSIIWSSASYGYRLQNPKEKTIVLDGVILGALWPLYAAQFVSFGTATWAGTVVKKTRERAKEKEIQAYVEKAMAQEKETQASFERQKAFFKKRLEAELKE